MSERHPLEIELAWLSESKDDEGVGTHVGRCSRCRRILADYDWLQGEVTSVLRATADGAPVPRPSWPAVRERLGRAQRRSERGRLVVVAGAALIACLMLVVPLGFGGKVEAQAAPGPVAVTAPAPVMVDRPLTGTRSWSTGVVASTRAEPREGRRTSLPVVPPPTPPRSGS
jgi:hypothetical protein